MYTCTHILVFHANSLHTHVYANYSRLYRFLTGEKGRPRATSMSMLKRYQNQSIICNNGFLKTTFHKLPPGGHVVSLHICQFWAPGSTASRTSCTSELSKGCLHVASYDALDENNSLGYHIGRDRQGSRKAVTIILINDFPPIKFYAALAWESLK